MGQGVRITSYWSADSVRIGEPVILHVEASLPKGSIPHFPTITMNEDAVTIVGTHLQPMAVDYAMTFWEVGKAVIPGIPVRIVDADGNERELVTDSLSIMVMSTLTEQDQDIRSIKAMVPLFLRKTTQQWLKLGLLLLALLATYLFWRNRKARQIAEAEEAARLDPVQTALDGIEELRNVEYHPTKAGVSYLALSRLVRTYLERRFLFRALEMTTVEIKEVLPKFINEPSTSVLINQILDHSDEAKFAGKRQNYNVWRNDLDLGVRIVEKTKLPDFIKIDDGNAWI